MIWEAARELAQTVALLTLGGALHAYRLNVREQLWRLEAETLAARALLREHAPELGAELDRRLHALELERWRLP